MHHRKSRIHNILGLQILSRSHSIHSICCIAYFVLNNWGINANQNLIRTDNYRK